jgi:hypothetical protein
MWLLLSAMRCGSTDFSGYTDIAIGIGIMFITLPENFKHPYLKTTLTAFCKDWHMTLSNGRASMCSRRSRWMLMRSATVVELIVVIAQLRR